MATAQLVTDAGPEPLTWLTIRDNGGNEQRYEKLCDVPWDTDAHVEQLYDQATGIRTVLVLGDQGLPVLKQDGHGLPEKIVVEFVITGPETPTALFFSSPAHHGKAEFRAVTNG